FEFTMTQDEVLDIFFEDLELPNLVRTTLKETPSKSWKRAGITTSGSPNQSNRIRTMRNSYGRRLALKRPALADLHDLQAKLHAAERHETQTDETRPLLAPFQERLAKPNSKRQ